MKRVGTMRANEVVHEMVNCLASVGSVNPVFIAMVVDDELKLCYVHGVHTQAFDHPRVPTADVLVLSATEVPT